MRQRIEPRAQRPNFLALPIDDIAQFDVGALQERYFRFEPLDGIAVHFDSVTVISPARAVCASAATIETNRHPGRAGAGNDAARRISRYHHRSVWSAHLILRRVRAAGSAAAGRNGPAPNSTTAKKSAGNFACNVIIGRIVAVL
jgi:hypothetical protein